MSRYFDYLYIFGTLGFTVYGQPILRWRVAQFGSLPAESEDKLKFILGLIFNPALFLVLQLHFFAWMAAMTKFDLSHAYPFMSLNFVVVLMFSGRYLSEPLSVQKVVGVGLIVIGTMIAARG